MTNMYHRQKSCLLTSLVAPKLLARQDGAQGPERNAQSLELNKHKEPNKLSCSCFTKEFTGMSRTTQNILDETNQCWYLWCTAYSLLMPCCWCHVVDESRIHLLLLSFVLFLHIITYTFPQCVQATGFAYVSLGVIERGLNNEYGLRELPKTYL